MKIFRAIAGCVALLLGAAAHADGQHVFWEVAGQHNKVYLLGSVHVLHAKDNALPSVTDAAYADAEVLVEELDLYAATADLFSAETMKLQFLPEGQTLAATIGTDLYAKLRVTARKLGLDLDYIGRMQPWCVATMISALNLQKAGYSPTDGVDYQIAERAHRDGKPIVGLETAAEQLGYLASMSMADQRRFLTESLDETEDPDELREITDAWRRGDLAALERELRQGMEDSPDLFGKVVTQRNRKWLPRIERMLADADKDYLVVTGALHMIGQDGLVEMLRARGYRITRK
jgi:uncharacterized protein YbaP (TraB family)